MVFEKDNLTKLFEKDNLNKMLEKDNLNKMFEKELVMTNNIDKIVQDSRDNIAKIYEEYTIKREAELRKSDHRINVFTLKLVAATFVVIATMVAIVMVM